MAEVLFAGECSRHTRSDGVAPRSPGRPPPDLSAVARIRGGRLPGVAAGLHRCSDGKRSRAADTQRCVNGVCLLLDKGIKTVVKVSVNQAPASVGVVTETHV